MTAPARLAAEEISFAYGGRDVLTSVSASVESGEIVGVLGPNGSGKTTLLRCMLGFLRPHAGRVALDGRDIASLGRRAFSLHVAAVPQETPTEFPLRLGELVALGRLPYLPAGGIAFEGAADLAAAEDALAACELGALADRPIHQLSGGELRRAFVARALAQAAPLLLLDEPTSGLDLRHQVAIAEILRERARLGAGVLVVLHDVNLAAALCDRVVLIKAGRVVAAGEAAEILEPRTLSDVYDVEVQAASLPGIGRHVFVPSPKR